MKLIIKMNEDLKKDLEPETQITVEPNSISEAKKPALLENSQNLTISKFDNFTDTKKILYNEPKPIPGAAPILSLFFLIVYTYIFVITKIVMAISCSYYILYIYSTDFDFSNLFLIIAGFGICFLLVNVFFYFFYGDRLPALNHKIQFICEGLLCFGGVFISLGFYLYLKKNIEISSVSYFVATDLTLSLLVSYYSFKYKLSLMQKPSSNFWLDLQIFLVIAKLASTDQSNWTSTLTISWIAAYFLFILGFILMVVFLVFFISALFGKALIAGNWLLTIGIMILYLILAFFCCSYYYIILGIQNLFEEKAFVPGGKSGVHDQLLNTVMFYYAIIASVLLFFTIIGTFFVYSLVKIYIKKNSSSLEISLTSFVKNLRVNMAQSSQNYFQKKKEGEKNEKTEIIKLDTCYVCYDKISDTLIQPCSHSGVCQDCIMQIFKNNIYDCPMCKKRIENVFLIFYDEEKNEYLSNGVIKFK